MQKTINNLDGLELWRYDLCSKNPLYKIWCDLLERPDARYLQSEYKKALSLIYAWAVPSPEVIAHMTQLSPLYEIGAGRGYWARLLQDAGADVIANEPDPPAETDNRWAPRRFKHRDTSFLGRKSDVEGAGPRTHSYFPARRFVDFRKANERTLFFCWPVIPCEVVMKLWSGDTLVYVGETRGGCCAEDEFFDMLDTSFVMRTDTPELPTWDGNGDVFQVWDRKR